LSVHRTRRLLLRDTADLASLDDSTVFPKGLPCVILYIYPLKPRTVFAWLYESDADNGISCRDIVRLLVATYKLMYAAEAADSSIVAVRAGFITSTQCHPGAGC